MLLIDSKIRGNRRIYRSFIIFYNVINSCRFGPSLLLLIFILHLHKNNIFDQNKQHLMFWQKQNTNRKLWQTIILTKSLKLRNKTGNNTEHWNIFCSVWIYTKDDMSKRAASTILHMTRIRTNDTWKTSFLVEN